MLKDLLSFIYLIEGVVEAEHEIEEYELSIFIIPIFFHPVIRTDEGDD